MKLNANHTVRFGLDYRENTATSSRVVAGRISYEVFSSSAMWDWQITPSVSLTNAVRYDHFVLHQQGFLVPDVGFTSSDYNRRTINEPSFNSGLVWQATEHDTFRLLAGRGLQLPSIYDLGLQDREPPGPNGSAFLFLGNPHVSATTVNNVEANWDRAVPTLHSTIRAAVFAQRTDNILTNPYEATAIGDGGMTSGGEEQRAIAQNSGRSAAVGGEVGLRGRAPSGLRWNLSYSFISISDHLSINQTGIYSPQDFQHGTPTHVVAMGGGYTLGRWEFDVQSRWQSQYRDYRGDPAQATLQPVEVSNYIMANAHAGYRLTDNITLGLSAQQFNTSRLIVSGGPPIERRVFMSVSIRL